MPPEFIVHKNGSGLHQLHIRGEFLHPHWMAFLFSGLSNHKISVLGGTASSVAVKDWIGRFDLDFSKSTLTPDWVDYFSLSQQETTLAFAPPKLTSFQVIRRADQLLEVTLHGPDQIGFLGRILVKLALLTLFPCELQIETVDGEIRDRIVFCGIGGQPPNASVEESLATILNGLT